MDNNSPQNFETGQPEQPQPPKPKPQPQPQPTPQKMAEAAKKVVKPVIPGTEKPAGKKFLLGCVIAFAAAILILVIVIFLFIGGPQTEGVNPIAKALGIDPASFVNTLITIVHVIFGVLAFSTFIMTMVGIFKASMAKKEDRSAKKRGAMMALAAGLMLIFTIFLWAGAYYYLSGKILEKEPGSILPPVITEPEEVTNLTAPISITFDATSAPINKTKYEVISYEWDFGDGKTGTGMIISHTYKDKGEDNGKFPVSLKIHLLDRKTAAAEVQSYEGLIVSISNVGVTARFDAAPGTGEVPLTVKFDASDSEDADGEIVRYDWDFDGDDSFNDAEGVKVEYEFEEVGTFTAKLRVTDNNGDYNIEELKITVKEASAPKAVIELESDIDEFVTGKTYVFSAAKSVSPNGNIKKYEWDFGDGTKKETTKTVSHTFETAGKFEVTLLVTDEEGDTGDTYMEIKVSFPSAAPEAVITTTPDREKDGQYLYGEVPFSVAFDASATKDADDNIVDYEWDFDGDEVTDAVGISKSHTYTKTGNYKVILTVTDADENISRDTLIVKVAEQGVNAKITGNPLVGPVPLKVTFDATGSTYPDGEIISYEWEFGDGSNKQLGDSKITHKYTKIGVFKASVTAIASDGERNTKTITVTVQKVPLQACFSPSKTEGNAPLIVIFDSNCSQGTITKYLWDFGDGETSVTNKPTHTFNKAGTRTVSLEVTDNDNNIDIFEETIIVTGELNE
ncbi:PKD domain-containing protein [Patescibacteria group bacterium]|nr:PKD domain-containing protein [Patescibacteria group bacterium]